MSTKRKTYGADFKAKLVLELLEGEQTMNEVASKYAVLPYKYLTKINVIFQSKSI